MLILCFQIININTYFGLNETKFKFFADVILQEESVDVSNIKITNPQTGEVLSSNAVIEAEIGDLIELNIEGEAQDLNIRL